MESCILFVCLFVLFIFGFFKKNMLFYIVTLHFRVKNQTRMKPTEFHFKLQHLFCENSPVQAKVYGFSTVFQGTSHFDSQPDQSPAKKQERLTDDEMIINNNSMRLSMICMEIDEGIIC